MHAGTNTTRRNGARDRALRGVVLASLCLAPLLLAACHGPYLSTRLGRRVRLPPAPTYTGGTTRRQPSRGPRPTQATRVGGKVRLTARDLAPVDAWLDHRSNSQWILGDEVEVVASREYFAQALTINRDGLSGLVHRTDGKDGDDTVVTMTFVGRPWQMSAMSNPRVLVGTGLTITARRRLRLRLTPTRDPRVPVRLHVTANGRAVRGRHEEKLKQGDVLHLGGQLRWNGRCWLWRRFGG